MTSASVVTAQIADESSNAVDSRSDARAIETITITARRSLSERFLSTGSMVTVDRKDIEQLGADSVGDVLRQLPGVQATPSANGTLEIRMRGMDKNATQILLDGQRVSSASAQLPFDQLPAELIERIEVVRAPSAEHAGATGGTINLVLRQASARRETNIRITDNHVWGRNAGQLFFSKTGPLSAQPVLTPAQLKEQLAQLAAADIPSSPWTYFLAASATQQLIGANTQRVLLGNQALVSDTDGGSRYRRSELSLIPRLNGKLSSKDQITLRATLNHSRLYGDAYSSGTAVDVPHGTYGTSFHEIQDRQRSYTQLGADWIHRLEGSKLETSVSASSAFDTTNRSGNNAQNYTPPSSSAYTFDDDKRERMWLLKSKLTGTQSDLLWMYGFELEGRSLSVNNSNTLSGAPTTFAADAQIDRRVLWAQTEWALPAKTTLTAGLRAQQLHTKSGDPATLQEQQRQFLQPSIHTRTPISKDMQWRLNAARVTRNPNVWDLLNRSTPSQGSNSINNPDSAGNPSLRSEVANTFDTGIESKLGNTGQMGAGVFVRQLSDVIATTTTLMSGRWVAQSSNVGNATVWGVEADAKIGLAALGLGSDWTLSTNASILQSRMNTGSTVGRRILGQARYLVNANIAKPLRRTGGWFGGMSMSLVGASDLDTWTGITGTEHARTSLDVYVGSVFPKLGYWRLGVYNLGNAKYIRDRSYTSGTVAYQDNSVMTLTPRVYFTVGTQF
ncbi:MAG: TonB-dependent receptor plug domain-containing protein [Cytophagales bacterium]|nr:TonB-dependent receptor plug domain-containing protein [Cytophagales bacterium]